MRLSVIVIHWNCVELMENLLTNLIVSDELEVIVVDNASAHLGKLKKKFPAVQWIENTLNRGFSFAANQGLLAATGEWLLFLNPDVQATSADFQHLIDFAEEKKFSACSPKFASGSYQKPVPSFWSLVAEFTWLGKILPLSFFQTKTLVGGCLLIKKSVLVKLGSWDQRFFLWFEDSDLSRRLLKADESYGFCPTTKIQHLGGASFKNVAEGTKKKLFFMSLQLFAKKHFSSFKCFLLGILTKKYTSNHLLPSDSQVQASIIVPNLKPELLKKFLEKNYGYFNFDTTELIVVTSSINWLELQRQYPEVIFIFQPHNQGFAQTVNIGFSRARGTYIGTVNDDTELTKDWIEKLISAAKKHAHVGSINPLILKPDTTVESLGIKVLPHGKAAPVQKVGTEIFVDATNAACVMYGRLALEEVGLFDERFGSYLEDIDLGLRLKRAGWQNLAVSAVKITHFGQLTSQDKPRKKTWQDVKNWWLVMLKNYRLDHWLKHFLPILLERARNLSGFVKSL